MANTNTIGATKLYYQYQNQTFLVLVQRQKVRALFLLFPLHHHQNLKLKVYVEGLP